MESFEVGPKLNPKDFIKVETPFEDLIRSLAVELVAKGFNPRIPYIVTVEENHYVISQEIPVEPKLYLTSEQINMIRKANPNLEKVNLEELGIVEIGDPHTVIGEVTSISEDDDGLTFNYTLNEEGRKLYGTDS